MLFSRIISRFKCKRERLFIDLKNILGFCPKDISYYKEAFTHSSYSNKNEKHISYERLEFLGDSILGAVIATYLFNQAPDKNEGYLTKMRSKMVQRRYLNELGKKLQLDKFVIKEQDAVLGEDIYGNLFESLVGAVYLDRGYEKATEFIYRVLISSISGMKNLEGKITSYKSVIIEWGQKNKKKVSFKSEEDIGAVGSKYFKATLYVEDEVFSKGRDTSKKKAEEKASKIAYYRIYKDKKNNRNNGTKVRNTQRNS